MSDRTIPSIRLPYELLIHIFDLATRGPARDVDALIELKPFEGDYSTDVDWQCDQTLETKRGLSLSCSLFRNLCAPFLYEDVRIGHGSEGLAEALEREPGVGSMVKRISIDPVGIKAAGQWCASFPKDTRRILERCKHVVILTRPQNLPHSLEGMQDEMPLPSGSLIGTETINLDEMHLPHLRRVDWFNSPVDILPSTLPTPKFIWKSPSIETLTIGPDHFPLQQDGTAIVDLPNLRTLRLRSMHTPGNVDEGTIDPASVKMPNLRRLVFSLPDGVYTLFFEQFLRAYGPRIEEIEIAPDPRFLRHDFISILLLNCSSATMLNFPVFTTKATRKNTRRQSVEIVYLITHIGLSAIGFREEAEDISEEESQWTLLAKHFLALLGERSRFSRLERLTLYGEEWDAVLSDSRCRGALRLLRTKNVEIVCEHESVAATLKIVYENLDFWLTSTCLTRTAVGRR